MVACVVADRRTCNHLYGKEAMVVGAWPKVVPWMDDGHGDGDVELQPTTSQDRLRVLIGPDSKAWAWKGVSHD